MGEAQPPHIDVPCELAAINGGQMSEAGFWVQLRFPGSFRWVTVAQVETRQAAAAYAGAAFRHATDAAGRAAVEARIRPTTSSAAPVDEAIRQTIETNRSTSDAQGERRRR